MDDSRSEHLSRIWKHSFLHAKYRQWTIGKWTFLHNESIPLRGMGMSTHFSTMSITFERCTNHKFHSKSTNEVLGAEISLRKA